MAKVLTSQKTQSFKYDFAVNGGAISSIGMGIFLPANAVPNSIIIVPVTDLTSGGVALVDIGILGATTLFVDNFNNSTTQDFTAYNASTYAFGLGQLDISTGGMLAGYSTKLTGPVEILVTISAFALTAGAFIGIFTYTEFN